MGFSWVIRDEHGAFVQARETPWNYMWIVLEGEALGILEALT